MGIGLLKILSSENAPYDPTVIENKQGIFIYKIAVWPVMSFF